jgi:hypothetical protein
VASGCNGSGFSSSLAIGEMLAAGITEDAVPSGLAGFSPDRFGRLTDEALVDKGAWQYAHYYDPAGSGLAAGIGIRRSVHPLGVGADGVAGSL